MFDCTLEYPKEKPELYAMLCEQMGGLAQGERRMIPNLANAAALISGALENINWAGFYLAEGGELVLGPFQGRPACITIPLGRGVCGTAAQADAVQVVRDVHEFVGHIACDSRSSSEIVLPIHGMGGVAAVLDIDSPVKARFDGADAEGLALFCRVLEGAIDWN